MALCCNCDAKVEVVFVDRLKFRAKSMGMIYCLPAARRLLLLLLLLLWWWFLGMVGRNQVLCACGGKK